MICPDRIDMSHEPCPTAGPCTRTERLNSHSHIPLIPSTAREALTPRAHREVARPHDGAVHAQSRASPFRVQDGGRTDRSHLSLDLPCRHTSYSCGDATVTGAEGDAIGALHFPRQRWQTPQGRLGQALVHHRRHPVIDLVRRAALLAPPLPTSVARRHA